MSGKKKYFTYNYDFLVKNKQDFRRVSTQKTERIFWLDSRMLFADNQYNRRELSIMMQCKKHIEDSYIFGKFIKKNISPEDKLNKYTIDYDTKKKFLDLKNFTQYNCLYKKTLKSMFHDNTNDIMVIDMNSAYPSLALSLGFIDLKIYNKLIDLKKHYKEKNIKKNINFLLGAAFMSDRVISEYRTGCETDTSYWSNPTGVFWILITYICDVLLRRISRDFNKFDAIALAYFVDGVFLNNSGKYSEDYLKQEFDTFFYQNLRVVYWEIIEKFGLNEAFLGNNPALFSWKFEQAELKKSKFPMANKLLIHHNGHLKPFFFATRQNKRYF